MESSKENISQRLNLSQAGWKYYKIIKKRAMNHTEEEFSLSGLFFSLFIAFFICLSSATALSVMNHYLEAKIEDKFSDKNIILESSQSPAGSEYFKDGSKRLNGVNLALLEVKKKYS